jgi:hypothetical protein
MLSEEVFIGMVLWECKVSLQPVSANTRGVNTNNTLKCIGCIKFDIYYLLREKNILR